MTTPEAALREVEAARLVMRLLDDWFREHENLSRWGYGALISERVASALAATPSEPVTAIFVGGPDGGHYEYPPSATPSPQPEAALREAAVAVCQLWFTDNAPEGSQHVRKAMLDLRAALAATPSPALYVERLARAVVDEATCERWGDLHSIRWASETFAALVVERYNGTMPPEYAGPYGTGTPWPDR